MSVYVDELHDYPIAVITAEARRHGTKWCHMTADTEKELHEMARKIGLGRPAYQDRSVLPHYDLTPSKREQAIRHGAIEIRAIDRLKMEFDPNRFYEANNE